MTISARAVVTPFGVHRYAVEHWHVLQPFVEGTEQDPKQFFFLASDTWDLWPYTRHGTPSYAQRYRVRFGSIRSFLKPFVKWYCYQQILQRPGDLSTTIRLLPYRLKRTDGYLLDHAYTSLDDLAPQERFEDLWAALLPQKAPPFAPREVQLQAATRSFWLHISALFGFPLYIPPVAPCVRQHIAETGLDEDAVVPSPVISQLTNILGLHREKKRLLNRFHHLRLCILLLSVCLGRRITEVLLSPRGDGSDGPLTTYPARGKGEAGGLWFRFEPNKDGRQNQVYISPAWHDIARYCVKTILFYSDEVRPLATLREQQLFILISERNLTSGSQSGCSHATEHDTDYDYRHLNKRNAERDFHTRQHTARAMTYAVFWNWLAGCSRDGKRQPSIFEQWGITTDGQATGEIYHMRSQQARHTRQSALSQDPSISPLIRQRDLNHTNRNMQLVYEHTLRQQQAKLRERVAQRQLHGLGTYWLEQCLGLAEPGAHTAWRPGLPALFDARWQALIVNNPLFIQVNRVPCGLCAFPQGPDACPEFMHCTEATDEGCAWFLTDPHDMQMQTELQERASAHRAKQQDSAVAGRTVQAHKYGVMAERTERLRNEALQKASDEVRRALLDELDASEGEA